MDKHGQAWTGMDGHGQSTSDCGRGNGWRGRAAIRIEGVGGEEVVSG